MKVAFYTLGCKVNQYETDLMIKCFKDKKYDIVDFDDKADIYVVNSCSVTNLSTRKTRQALSKAKRKSKLVVLVGCYAQEIKDKIDIKNVDIILGNEEKKDIVNFVEEYFKEKKDIKYEISDISKVEKYVQKSSLDEGNKIRESIKIEDGCNNFCTYCIIPYVRGRVRSRKLEEILEEAKNITKDGAREIVLVGIEIASYGKDLIEDVSVIDVVEELSKIQNVERIRFGSIEPRLLNDNNLERLTKLKKFCPHFHLSLQSLDNNILKKMNRHYTKEYIESLCKKIIKLFPDAALTCDLIVAFPGETEEEFKNTFDTLKKLYFYEANVFKYSKRKYTKAANMENQVDGNIAERRSKELIKLATDLKNEYLKKYINRKMDVLFESYNDGYLYGYTNNYIKVKVKGDSILWGKVLEVELCKIEENLILGKL